MVVRFLVFRGFVIFLKVLGREALIHRLPAVWVTAQIDHVKRLPDKKEQGFIFVRILDTSPKNHIIFVDQKDVVVRLVGVQHRVVQEVLEERRPFAEHGLMHGQHFFVLDLHPKSANLFSHLPKDIISILLNALQSPFEFWGFGHIVMHGQLRLSDGFLQSRNQILILSANLSQQHFYQGRLGQPFDLHLALPLCFIDRIAHQFPVLLLMTIHLLHPIDLMGSEAHFLHAGVAGHQPCDNFSGRLYKGWTQEDIVANVVNANSQLFQ